MTANKSLLLELNTNKRDLIESQKKIVQLESNISQIKGKYQYLNEF